MNPVKVLVRAADPMTAAGINSCLGGMRSIEVVADEQRGPVDVVVVAIERMSVEVASSLRKIKAALGVPIVLIAGEIKRSDLFSAVECNVVAVVPRAAATSERIENAVTTAAAGGGVLPAQMVGDLLKHVERVQREILAPNGLHTSGLTPREIDVLQLMSEGLDTAEIAFKLSFSERAVKKVIYGMTSRLKLRNRPHAVAYALRMGVI